MFYFENYMILKLCMEIIILICEFHFSIEWGHYIILCKGAIGFDQVEVIG